MQGIATSLILGIHVVMKCCDRLGGAWKCWANDFAICRVEMLRSLGQGFDDDLYFALFTLNLHYICRSKL